MRLRHLSTAVLALSLAGCATPRTVGPSGSAHTADVFTARAEQVAAAWPGSPAEQAWQHEYIPLGNTDVLPPSTGPHADSDKQALIAGRLRVSVPLPTPPPTLTVRWKNGGKLALPALAPMRAANATTSGGGTRLTVTSVGHTTLTVPTSRGTASVPAWSIRLKGYQKPWVVAAVAPTMPGPPAVGPTGKPDPSLVTAGLDSVSADGRTLKLTLGEGDCGIKPSARVYETADAVVVGGLETRKPSGDIPCTAQMIIIRLAVHLAAPLGARTVLDAATGEPLAPSS